MSKKTVNQQITRIKNDAMKKYLAMRAKCDLLEKEYAGYGWLTSSGGDVDKLKEVATPKLQHELMDRHVKANAPSTQNVRNIEPAHVTLIRILPRLESKGLNKWEAFSKFKEAGGLVNHATFYMMLYKMAKYGKINRSGCKYYFNTSCAFPKGAFRTF